MKIVSLEFNQQLATLRVDFEDATGEDALRLVHAYGFDKSTRTVTDLPAPAPEAPASAAKPPPVKAVSAKPAVAAAPPPVKAVSAPAPVVASAAAPTATAPDVSTLADFQSADRLVAVFHALNAHPELGVPKEVEAYVAFATKNREKIPAVAVIPAEQLAPRLERSARAVLAPT